jgi:hypothetical protein
MLDLLSLTSFSRILILDRKSNMFGLYLLDLNAKSFEIF